MAVLLFFRNLIQYQELSDTIIQPKDDEVQIKVTAVSICGSDINVWKWNDTAKVGPIK